MSSSERPPTLTFELDWVNAEEKLEILEQMRLQGRQTMNLRLMPGARLMRLRAVDDAERIVGWAGCDPSAAPGIAEVFSLFVIPEYRTFTVGAVLETARAIHLKSLGVTRMFGRMEANSNTSLLRYRLSTGVIREAPKSDFPPETVAMCQRCELHDRSCLIQTFIWIDIDTFIERGIARLGEPLESWTIPRRVMIDPARIRRAPRSLHPPGPALTESSTPIVADPGAPPETELSDGPRESTLPPA